MSPGMRGPSPCCGGGQGSRASPSLQARKSEPHTPSWDDVSGEPVSWGRERGKSRASKGRGPVVPAAPVGGRGQELVCWPELPDGMLALVCLFSVVGDGNQKIGLPRSQPHQRLPPWPYSWPERRRTRDPSTTHSQRERWPGSGLCSSLG